MVSPWNQLSETKYTDFSVPRIDSITRQTQDRFPWNQLSETKYTDFSVPRTDSITRRTQDRFSMEPIKRVLPRRSTNHEAPSACQEAHARGHCCGRAGVTPRVGARRSVSMGQADSSFALLLTLWRTMVHNTR
ncbi:hypothetical protein J6590_036738 [Homalodisca vitripennis]|nr:hypothetical protein J6590_036738 [Homalodisca vitripennis]